MDAAARKDEPAGVPPLDPPGLHLLALEGRWALDWLSLRLAPGFLKSLPRGDGHPVLVLPGFGMTDYSTAPLRRAIGRLHYSVHGWDQGRNLGLQKDQRFALDARLRALADEEGGPVSLIGWSLGGVYARELARKHPDRVRRLITLGAPINVRPDANRLDAVFRTLNPGFRHDFEGFRRRITPPPVPCTAVYTRTDGIIAWPATCEPEAPNTENVEVRGSHMGLGFSRAVIRVIAERLARPAGA